MTAQTSIVKAGEVNVQNGLMIVTGKAEFTADEHKAIRARMTPESERYISNAGREHLELNMAERDLTAAIKRAERALRDTRQFRDLQDMKQNLRILRARRADIETKCLGVFESMLSTVRKGTALYKKIAMSLASREEGV